MAQGIYKLIFKNTNKVYIGQSIHIDKRFATHLNELKNGTHSIKLQEAYNLYGIPDLVILEEVLEENLDTAEERYIQLFNSVSNGFNSTHSASGGVSLGENNGRSKYSNTQIIEAVELMVEFPDISLKVLANTLNISWDTIKQIARGNQYKWLEEVMPETYFKLLNLKNTRKSTGNSIKGIGKSYPKIQSPEGIVYEIDNGVLFSKEHNLQQSNLYQVLNGNRKSHKGWKLA